MSSNSSADSAISRALPTISQALDTMWGDVGQRPLATSYQQTQEAIDTAKQPNNDHTPTTGHNLTANYTVELFTSPVHLLREPAQYLAYVENCLDGKEQLPQPRTTSEDADLLRKAFGESATTSRYYDFLEWARQNGLRRLYLAATQYLNCLERGCVLDSDAIADKLDNKGVTAQDVTQMLTLVAALNTVGGTPE